MLSLLESKPRVEAFIKTFLDKKIQDAAQIHPSYETLLKEISRVTLAGGKRLRPHLVFVGYGSYDDAIMPIAAAHELLHTALLIHDDIIDRDNIRHDQATIHHEYNTTHYRHCIDDDADRLHFSTSAAVLAGDILISFAYELTAAADLPAESRAKAAATLAKGIFEVAGGELLDTEAAFLSTSKDPLLVYKYKTASYSFVSPLLNGAQLSPLHSDPETRLLLEEYAINTGVAYQIHDDIIGIFGDESVTGKTTTGDLREGKDTLLIGYFKERATLNQQAHFAATFGDPQASAADLSTLKMFIKDSGALDQAQAIESEYSDRATQAVQKMSHSDLQNQLLSLTEILMKRKA